jgi:hypothetical protein
MADQPVRETVSTGKISINQTVMKSEHDHCELRTLLVITLNGVAMPIGTNLISVESHGYSAWTTTAKVSAILPDQDSKLYFLKV